MRNKKPKLFMKAKGRNKILSESKVLPLIVTLIAMAIVLIFQNKSLTKQDKILDEGTFTKPEEVSQIDTSNWKTYHNKEYGYKIKCPNNWRMSEESTDHPDDIRLHCAHFSSVEKEGISITVYPKYWEGAIREAFSIILEEKVIVGGIEGIKIIGRDQKDCDKTFPSITSVVIVTKGSYLYELKGEGGYFDHIISTFTFIR